MKPPIERLRAYFEERYQGASEPQRTFGEDLGRFSPAGRAFAQGTISKVLGGHKAVGLDLGAAIEHATKGWRGGQIKLIEWHGYVPPKRVAKVSSEPDDDAEPNGAAPAAETSGATT